MCILILVCFNDSYSLLRYTESLRWGLFPLHFYKYLLFSSSLPFFVSPTQPTDLPSCEGATSAHVPTADSSVPTTLVTQSLEEHHVSRSVTLHDSNVENLIPLVQLLEFILTANSSSYIPHCWLFVCCLCLLFVHLLFVHLLFVFVVCWLLLWCLCFVDCLLFVKFE